MPGIYLVEADNTRVVRWLGTYHSWGLHKALGGDSSNYDRHSGRILDLKENQAAAIDHFAGLIEPLLATNFGVCVVPSHDPAKGPGGLHALAARLCLTAGRQNMTECLRRHTKIDKLATGGDRSKAVHLGSMETASVDRLKGLKILLLDDVITTGASIEASSELLLKAGASQVRALALGKTP